MKSSILNEVCKISNSVCTCAIKSSIARGRAMWIWPLPTGSFCTRGTASAIRTPGGVGCSGFHCKPRAWASLEAGPLFFFARWHRHINARRVIRCSRVTPGQGWLGECPTLEKRAWPPHSTPEERLGRAIGRQVTARQQTAACRQQ